MQKNIFFLLGILLTTINLSVYGQSQSTPLIEYKSKGTFSLTLGGGIFTILKPSADDYRILKYGHFQGSYWVSGSVAPYLEYNFGKRTFSKIPEKNKRYQAIGIGSQYYLPFAKKIFFLDVGYHLGDLSYFQDVPAEIKFLSTVSYGAGLNLKIYKNWYLGIDFKRYNHLYESINYTAGNLNLNYFFSKNRGSKLKVGKLK